MGYSGWLMLYWYRGEESIGDSDDDGSDGTYKGSAEPVLVPLSESYSEDDRFLSR